MANCGFLLFYSKPALWKYYNFFVNGFHYDSYNISDHNSLIIISTKNYTIKSLGCSLYTGVAYWQVNTVPFALGQDFKYNIPTIPSYHHAILL